MDHILCPHCKKKVLINEVLSHQIKEQLSEEFKKQHEDELIKQKQLIEEDIRKKIKEELDFKLKDSANELEDSKKQNKELKEQLLEMTQLIRGLKEQNSRIELESQKKLNQELEKLREDVSKTEKEKSNLKVLELEKQLLDTKKALEDAQRKVEQKSQQLQGEVLELDLESELQDCFPTDDILPVPKGIEGGDIWQKVKNKHGQVGGSILWETKRTKLWSNSWLGKLREDTRQVGASVSILISEVLPEQISTFGLVDGVWVTSYKYAIPLAQVLRDGILRVAIAKASAAHKDEKLEALYSYLVTDGFRHRFEAQVESIIELKNDLETEQRSAIRLWKKREMQINRMKKSVASLYGELQGILGPSLPSIRSLEAMELLPSPSQKDLLDE